MDSLGDDVRVGRDAAMFGGLRRGAAGTAADSSALPLRVSHLLRPAQKRELGLTEATGRYDLSTRMVLSVFCAKFTLRILSSFSLFFASTISSRKSVCGDKRA